MIRSKTVERESKKPNQEARENAEVSTLKLQNHHSIDAILGRKRVGKHLKRHNMKSANPEEYSDDVDDRITDEELSPSEAKSGMMRLVLLRYSIPLILDF
jgi:hypothetical protein